MKRSMCLSMGSGNIVQLNCLSNFSGLETELEKCWRFKEKALAFLKVTLNPGSTLKLNSKHQQQNLCTKSLFSPS